MPVNMLKGISTLDAFLAIVSTPTINIPPSNVLTGISFLFSDPIIARPICGITSPTHPIVPAILTALAVSMVENTINRYFDTLLSLDELESSIRKRFSFQRNIKIQIIDNMIGNETKNNSSIVTAARLPSVQNVIGANCVSVSAKYLIKPAIELNMPETTIPANTRVIIALDLKNIDIRIVSATATSPVIKAENIIGIVLKPRRIAILAPTVAPDDTPRIS